MDDVTRRAQELYDAHPYGDFSYDRQRERFYPLLLEALRGYRAGQQLWDVGCGSGFWARSYVEHGIPIEAIHLIDLSTSAIAALKARGFDATVGDATALDVPDGAADITICNGVIHHTSDPFRAFSELVRITRPGGTIYVAVYNRWHPHFYLVHRLAAPLRWAYWNVSKRSALPFMVPAALLMQVVARLTTGHFTDWPTLRTKFADEVLTPRAALFTRPQVREWAARCGARVVRMEYFVGRTMITALLEKAPGSHANTGELG